MNPLLDAFGQSPQQGLLQQFREFQRTVTGDPEQQVRELIRTGRMTQQQFDELARMANQLSGILK